MSTLANDIRVPQVVPLGQLSAGASGTIVEIDGQPDLVARLQSMGLRNGCHVRMIRPGAACLIAIDNHRLGFRGAEAAFVHVELTEAVS